MDIKLIDQLYIKLSPEYKTKKEVYERIKRELSLEMQTDSIKRKHERYLKKKKQDRTKNRTKNQRQDKKIGQQDKNKKTKSTSRNNSKS